MSTLSVLVRTGTVHNCAMFTVFTVFSLKTSDHLPGLSISYKEPTKQPNRPATRASEQQILIEYRVLNIDYYPFSKKK